LNGFLETDMREQTYPPKRPNMGHFASPEKLKGREETELHLDRVPAEEQDRGVLPQQTGEKPAP
jgi:hypothetical protein